jgi:UDP-N-acetylglucosamine--N-acetylmuramyl-(pentapeptide) pyrophosphoryl-undecaprenol N-acetylglucosamine transferase
VGNPVRSEIAAVSSPELRYAERSGPLRVLVVGGSLGAAVLNEVVPAALAQIPESRRPVVTHQAGAKQIDALRAAYGNARVDGELLPFIEDMAERYARADLVICRSGALTVAELAAVGVASVLVPFPHAVDDHQSANARFLSEQGAAVLIPQKELDPARLAALLDSLDRNALTGMACQARKLARPEAARAVADICVELAEGARK